MFDLRRLIAYDHWANGETLASLERMDRPPAKALARMGHLLAAEAGWLRRMGIDVPFAGFWEETDLATLRARRDRDLPRHWAAFFADAARSDPGRVIEYRNSKGEPWKSAVGDVLLHVVLHSAYHRGQVASDVRAAGAEPAVTDFAHATRTGAVR